MESYLGVPLSPDQHVHHINGIRNDNRIENLEIIGIREHGSMHSKERWHKESMRVSL